MNETKLSRVPYESLTPGVEAIFTGEDPSTVQNPPELDLLPGYSQLLKYVDSSGLVRAKWSTWNMPDPWKEGAWEDTDIRLINSMQAELGHLDDNVRQIRAHIASLVPCDNGIPVTIDELLDAIGSGRLREPSFHNGCCAPARWWDSKGTQPHHTESMRTIHNILTAYLAGESREALIAKHPYAEGFIHRTYDWLGPRSELTRLQQLMLERILLLAEVCGQEDKDFFVAAHKDLFEEGGRGERKDAEIAVEAGLPKIYAEWRPEFRETIKTIDDPDKKALYEICGAIAHGLHGISDCHHSTYRWLENWLYAIGTGKWGIPTHKAGAEKERLGRLLFGYILGLDEWLAGVPMQFVLMDLDHIDPGFDPKNEILRVYAYLGEDRTPVKRWLAASLWWTLLNNRPAGLAHRHKELIDLATSKGIPLHKSAHHSEARV